MLPPGAARFLALNGIPEPTGTDPNAAVLRQRRQAIANRQADAWQATADVFFPRPFVRKYWERAQVTYEPSFRRFVNERMAAQQR